jgi:hypothetical protein
MTDSEFGFDKEKLHDNYIGRWVLIYSSGLNTAFSGKLMAIKEGYGLLNPFQHEEIKEGKLVRKLVEDDIGSIVPLIGSAIEPTTEEYLTAYCEMLNKKESKKKESKK